MKTALAPFRPTHISHKRDTKTLINKAIRENLIRSVIENSKAISSALIATATDIESSNQVNAARLLLEYTIGKAEQKVQHTGAVGIVSLVAKLEQDADQDNLSLGE